MRIGLQTWGSDGDILPFIALSGGLRAAGHEVTLAASSADEKDYTVLADALDFSIQHVGRDVFGDHEERFDAVVAELKKSGRNPIKRLKIVLDGLYFPVVAELYSTSKDLCEENDIVVGHFLVHPLKVAAARMDSPHVTVTLNHSGIPSRYIPPVGLPDLGRWLNRFSWRLLKWVVNRHYKRAINELCVREGHAPFADVLEDAWESRELSLVAVSPVFCERQLDWGDHRQVCGFLNLPDAADTWRIPDDLDCFLKSGPPPVYMTFGSMSSRDPEVEQAARLMIDAVKMANARAIVQTRWEDMTDIPEDPNIYRIGKAPHRLLFPHCSAVIHHGGAGTTQSATRCGCPSIVVEHFGDQWFWGKELNRLGVAPNLLHRRGLTRERLAREIETVLSTPAMKQRAGELGEMMKDEDAVGRAVELIERRFEKGRTGLYID